MVLATWWQNKIPIRSRFRITDDCRGGVCKCHLALEFTPPQFETTEKEKERGREGQRDGNVLEGRCAITTVVPSLDGENGEHQCPPGIAA